jgi:KUP system potassium uptake protein
LSEEKDRPKRRLFLLSLGALGVVYGDIGTSPLYAFRECFHGPHAISITDANIIGVLSLIFWSLLLVISFKYLIIIMRADNEGEGGILALMELVLPGEKSRKGAFIFLLGIFGATLLYGDGIITPAISVLSAVEGLEVATPVFESYVVPITIVILTGLFLLQRRGTGGVGRLFGPVMLVWFTVLGILGLTTIFENLHVFTALNPIHAIEFFIRKKLQSLYVLGAIFLVVTGGEALYADLGHFGRRPIRLAWFTLVLPGLLLNYFGQGALLLNNHAVAENPFYFLAPEWALYPMVVLATVATIIASQAIISGVFSLTSQSVQLGYLPRLPIKHTSKEESGQVYIEPVNWLMLAATLGVVLGFQSSSALAGAYGVAVASTMVITDILAIYAMRNLWRWALGATVGLTGLFLLADLGYLTANLLKILDGGWFPLLVGIAIYILYDTYVRGRRLLLEQRTGYLQPLKEFVDNFRRTDYTTVDGTAIFMTGSILVTPPALLHNLKHNKVIHKQVVFLSVGIKNVPHVPPEKRLILEDMGNRFYRMLVKYGYMDRIDIQRMLTHKEYPEKISEIDLDDITYFLGRQTLIPGRKVGMSLWRDFLFKYLMKVSQDPTRFFHIPLKDVFEVGEQLEI